MTLLKTFNVARSVSQTFSVTTIVFIADRTTAPFDVLVMPTLPIVPPAIAPVEADDALWMKANALFIRNNGLVNFLDRCALTLPCHRPGDAPVGLMLVGETMGDRRLLAIGRAVERALGHHVQ